MWLYLGFVGSLRNLVVGSRFLMPGLLGSFCYGEFQEDEEGGEEEGNGIYTEF